jgi:hypothetical protein
MNWRGEQGEHLGRFWVLSPRALGDDREMAKMLTLLTPLARPDTGDERGGGLA